MDAQNIPVFICKGVIVLNIFGSIINMLQFNCPSYYKPNNASVAINRPISSERIMVFMNSSYSTGT